MKRKTFFGLWIAFLLALSLILTPVLAEDSYDASTMRLLRYDGNVEIFDTEGVSRFVMENVRFASGESMQTGEESSASVGLDDTKIVTLDAQTNVGFVQEGEHMLLNLLEGQIFIDVSEKLDENASFDIQTTTMTVGIRGTIIFAQVIPGASPADPTTTAFGVMEGKGQVDATDSSGNHLVYTIVPGELITATDDGSGQGTSFSVREMTAADTQGFIQNVVNSDEALVQRVLNANPNGAQLLAPPTEGGEISSVSPENLYPANGTWTWTDPVQIVAQSASKLYDGEPLRRPDNVLVSGLPDTCSISVSCSGSRTDAGTAVNRVDHFVISNSLGQDITGHFTNVETVDGTLRVDPAPLTIWTGSAEKVYDGEPLTCEDAGIRTVPGYIAEEPVWRNTSIVSRTALGAETMVGVSGSVWVHGSNPVTGEEQEIELKTGQRLVVNLSDEDSKESISFTVETLDVKDLPEDVLRLYADNPELMAQACADVPEWDPAELQARVNALDESDEATVIQNGLKVLQNTGNDVMIDSSNVRITMDSGITNYSTQVLTGTVAHFVPISLDPSIKITATGEQTAIGEGENTYEIKWGNADPDNYSVEEDLGTLKVEPLDVQIHCGGGVTTTYDGKAFIPYPSLTYLNGSHKGERIFSSRLTGSVPGAFVSDTRLRAASHTYHFVLFTGDTLDLVISGFGTAPGDYTLTGSVTSSSPNLGSISLSFSGAKLVIEPAELVISTGSAQKEYDGEPLTCEDVAVSGLVGEDTITVKATGKQTEAGASKNTYTIDWGSVDPSCYKITESLGILEVTKAENIEKKAVTVTITGNTDSKQYSKAEQSLEGYTVTVSSDLYTEKDFTFNGTAVAKGTIPGTYAMGLKADQFKNTNDAFDVTFTVTDGSLEITPCPVTVTITGKKDVQQYTGEEFQVEGYEVEISDSLYTEEDFTFSGEAATEGTAPDTYIMGLEADQFNNINNNFDATFAVTDGELEITANDSPITITAKSADKVYDGEELVETETTVEGLPDNDLLWGYGVTEGSQTNVGSSTNKVVGHMIGDREENDVTEYFTNVTYVDGTLEVTARPVTVAIAGNSDTVVYNGDTQTVSGYSVTSISDSKYSAEYFALKDTISAVAQGQNFGTYIMGLGSGSFKNNNSNFDVTFDVTDGWLQITKVSLTVTTPNDSKVYDGSPLPTTTDLPSLEGLVDSDIGKVTVSLRSDQLIDVNTEEVRNKYVISWGPVSSENYDIDEQLGTLTVSKRTVILTSANASKDYDGTALTNHTVTVGGNGWAAGEGATYDFTGSQTEGGSSANSFTYTLNQGTKAGNYDITKQEGTLTVTRTLTHITFNLHCSEGTYTATGYACCPPKITGTYEDGTEVSGSSIQYDDPGSVYVSATIGTFTLQNGETITITCPDFREPGSSHTYTVADTLSGNTSGYTIEYVDNVITIEEPGHPTGD